MIRLESVHKSYTQGHQVSAVLHGVDLQVESGQIYGIIGESGAGKSTLLRCMNLLERPDKGAVWVNGQNLATLTPAALRQARQNIGMIFQNFNLLSSRTVFENIRLPLEIFPSEVDIPSRVKALIAQMGLEGLEDRYPSQLSGGQKQRVAIARALAHRPRILLCDEATSALDPGTTASILQLLRRLNKELDLTIVLISHQMGVIKTICDHVGILEGGQLIESAPVLELFASPKSEAAKAFVAHTTHMEIPAPIAAQMVPTASMDTQSLYLLTYIGSTVSEPVLSLLVSEHGLTINIIQAHIEIIQGQTLGRMMITLDGSANALFQGLAFLEAKGLYIEVLGHVKRLT